VVESQVLQRHISGSADDAGQDEAATHQNKLALGGAIFTETIFRWPGLGQYAVQTATKLDFAGILGVTLVVAVVFVLFNFVVDILYGVLDPRIRLA